MRLDRSDRAALLKIGIAVALTVLGCLLLLAVALALGSAIHILRWAGGV